MHNQGKATQVSTVVAWPMCGFVHGSMVADILSAHNGSFWIREPTSPAALTKEEPAGPAAQEEGAALLGYP